MAVSLCTKTITVRYHNLHQAWNLDCALPFQLVFSCSFTKIKASEESKKDMINSCFRNKKEHMSLVMCAVTPPIRKNSSFASLMTHLSLVISSYPCWVKERTYFTWMSLNYSPFGRLAAMKMIIPFNWERSLAWSTHLLLTRFLRFCGTFD